MFIQPSLLFSFFYSFFLSLHSLVSLWFSFSFFPFLPFLCYFQSFPSVLFLSYFFPLLGFPVPLLPPREERWALPWFSTNSSPNLGKATKEKGYKKYFVSKTSQSFRTVIQRPPKKKEKKKSMATFNMHEITTQRYHSLSTIMSQPVLEAVGYGKHFLSAIHGQFCKIIILQKPLFSKLYHMDFACIQSPSLHIPIQTLKIKTSLYLSTYFWTFLNAVNSQFSTLSHTKDKTIRANKSSHKNIKCTLTIQATITFLIPGSILHLRINAHRIIMSTMTFG